MGWKSPSYARFISHLDETIHHEGRESIQFYNNEPISESWFRFNIANNETWWHTGSLHGTATRFERNLVDNEPVVMVLLTNTRPWSPKIEELHNIVLIWVK